MREVRRSAIVPHSPAQMFELVADVESYPEFLPGCAGAELLTRGPDELTGTIELSQGPLSARFTTRNRLDPPRAMGIELVEGPFSDLRGEWRFEPLGESGCRIELTLRFAFASRWAERLMGAAFELTCNRLVDAFVKRAAQRYG